MTSLNGIDIPQKPIVTVDFPPMPNMSSNNIIKNLLKENEQLNYDLNYDLNVLKFILQE